MNKRPAHDIFVSCRRKGGHETALLLCQTLVRAGCRVAYDIENIRRVETETAALAGRLDLGLAARRVAREALRLPTAPAAPPSQEAP